jgi:hypothetical protein
MNDFERRELADDASELLANKAFMAALAQLEKDAVERLLTPNADRDACIAEIKIARTLPQQFKIYMDKYRRRAVG